MVPDGQTDTAPADATQTSTSETNTAQRNTAQRNTVTEPTQGVNAPALVLEHEAVPAGQSVAGSPRTGSVPVGEFGGLEVGVWEMTVGTMTDIEVDEVFVVLSGQATVSIAGQDPPLILVAGDVVILRAGMQTTWTVTETLRKVYLA